MTPPPLPCTTQSSASSAMCHSWLHPLCHGSITSAMNLSRLRPFCLVSLTTLPVFHASLTAPRPQACTTHGSAPSAMYFSRLHNLCHVPLMTPPPLPCTSHGSAPLHVPLTAPPPLPSTSHGSAPSALYPSWLPAPFSALTSLLCTTHSSTPSAWYLSQLRPLCHVNQPATQTWSKISQLHLSAVLRALTFSPVSPHEQFFNKKIITLRLCLT